MPTVNQIIRKGRGSKKTKSKSPALLVGVNTIERHQTKQVSEIIARRKAGWNLIRFEQ